MKPHTWPADWQVTQRRAMAHGYCIAVNADMQYELRQLNTAPPVVLAGPFVGWAETCAALERAINPPKPLEFISLFAGIGGMDLGLERAGMRCVAQVEIDDYATRVLAKHWPDVPRFRDVRHVGASNLPPADLICGGFPCQDISNAGKRAGITGERSGLWREFARIIGELRPRYALIENVSALLGRGLDAVLCDLAALGYDAEWHCIPAAAVGAPHIRDRLFVLAYANGAERRAQSEGRHIANRDDAGRPKTASGLTARRANGRATPLADAHGAGLSQRHEQRTATATPGAIFARGEFERARTTTGRKQWEAEPNVGRVADGVPRRVDRLRGLGNAVVPQVAEFIGKMIVDFDQREATQ